MNAYEFENVAYPNFKDKDSVMSNAEDRLRLIPRRITLQHGRKLLLGT